MVKLNTPKLTKHELCMAKIATVTLEFANYGDSEWRGDLRRWRKAGITHEVLPVECHYGAQVKLTGPWHALRAYIVNVYAPSEPALQVELLATVKWV